MIEINLVPDVKQELLKAQRIRSTVITGAIFIGVIAVSIVVALAIYVFTVQTVRDGILNKNITDGSNKLAGDGTSKNPGIKDLSKTITIQNQLSKISNLNNSKKIDSRIFDLLTAIVPPSPNDVQISDLTIDSSSSTITMNGQASNSYAAVEVFKKTISGAKVKYNDIEDGPKDKAVEKLIASSISTSNTSYGEDATGAKVLRFTISFIYTEELFSPKSKNLTIVISNKGNATDSYIGVPSIFADRASDITGGH